MTDRLIEFERETDGRWIADISSLPGAMAYGETRCKAESNARAIAVGIVECQYKAMH